MLDIEIKHISKVFNAAASSQATRAVDEVSQRIEPGELFFLLGPSGCGKTTLLRMLAGFIEPTGGELLFNGRDVTREPPEKRQLAMVFQNYALWPHMTVSANVEFGPRMAGMDRAARRARADQMLESVGLSGFGERKPTQLSGGQAQRVALARAMAGAPKGLLLDEPLSNLDAALRTKMRSEIRRIVKHSGATAVYVTHDQVEALSMADRLAVMDAGRIVQVGSPEDVYRRPVNRFVADFLGEANFLTARISDISGEKGYLTTSAGTLRATEIADGFKDGDEVTCCIRPESLVVLRDGSNANSGDILANSIEAVCMESVLLGATSRSVFELAEKKKLIAVGLSSDDLLIPGSSYKLGVRPRDIIVLPK